MTYKEAIDWLFVQLPMYQKVGKSAFKADLHNIEKLAKYLGNPETKFKSVHVAGTNGKGSTSHMIASVLQEAGYKVGLYTSPHLKDFRERIRINGAMASQDFVTDFVKQHQIFFKENKLSFFEMTVGMAFQYFASAEVDIAIIEVGLGGRLDSTNIIRPEVSVITNIGFDHVAILGDTLKKIASEKAGVIKKEVPCVIGRATKETKEVFKEVGKKNNSPIYFVANEVKSVYVTDLGGDYQKENIKTAFKALDILKNKGWNVTDDHFKRGFSKVSINTGLMGRWQVLGEEPLIVCDTAHNEDGLKLVMKQVEKTVKAGLHIVIGIVVDKDLEVILPLFPKGATYYFTKPNNKRALPVGELQMKANGFGLFGETFDSVKEAFFEAQKNANKLDMIYVGGSTFVVSEII